MDINIIAFSEILNSNIGTKVRYRIEGKTEFSNGVLKSFSISNGNNISIQIDDNVIDTLDVYQISCTNYDERVDVWLYGKQYTNRFNIYFE